MDKKDLQILRLLGENCRLNYATIAKAINVSKDTAKNRIKALEENKTITHYNTMVDLRPLDISKFQLFIKLKNTAKNKEVFLEQLAKHNSFSFVNTFIGKYDLHIIVDTKDIHSFENIKKDIFETLRDQIQDYTILTFFSDVKHCHLIPETNLEIKFKREKDSAFSSMFKESFELEKEYLHYSPDQIDINLLKILTKNPKTSLVNLSENLRLNREAVKQRIAKLINKKIIKNFGANTSFDAFGYVTYFLLIKTNEGINDEQLRKEFKKIKNIYYSAKTHGDYSLITYVLAKNPKELKETIKKIQETLENKILEMEVMIFDEIKLYKQFPTNVIKELEAKA
ncbi:MAG: AsnC family transcriptional regulator [archaeon]